MTIGITKKGNYYQKSNQGKIIATGLGAVGGAFIASKNSQQIRSKIKDIYVASAKKAGKGILKSIKEFFTGKFDFSKIKENTKLKGNVLKYGNKILCSVKKHPVLFGAIAGAVAFFGIGALIDKNINKTRANIVDKNVESK